MFASERPNKISFLSKVMESLVLDLIDSIGMDIQIIDVDHDKSTNETHFIDAKMMATT